jgi:putative SOS response-associated peptidase YedK
MCGRFSLTAEMSALQEMFPWVNFSTEIQPRYNIAPSQSVAVITNDGTNSLDFFHWGLIPSWAKDIQIGSQLINARAETITEKPSFRISFRRRRCLVLADGFFEWQKQGDSKRKIPNYIHLVTGKPFAFAGLWERWTSPEGNDIKSCTIITTQPNSLMEPIHNRMPVILRPEDYQVWLRPGEQAPAELTKLLNPFPADLMKAYMVSPLVNSPANDLPACIQSI